METNIWPNIEPVELPTTPKLIIQDAGKGLAERTNSKVVFYVMSTNFANGIVSMTCSLYARQLSYHYPFLKAKFPITTLYPVQLTVDKMEKSVEAKNADELLAGLQVAFNAPSTIETIKQLLALSTNP